MNVDLHNGLKMEKAACAFMYLASTSFSVLPLRVMRLPRYLKAVIHSSISVQQMFTLKRHGINWLLKCKFAGHAVNIPRVNCQETCVHTEKQVTCAIFDDMPLKNIA